MQYSGDLYMGDKINRIWLKNYINIGGMGDFSQLYKEGFDQSEAFLVRSGHAVRDIAS